MDYNQIREGSTVYLPVSAPGALLFIGDGHAAQGDGELTGNALETSMDVEFTVDVIKGQATGGPRAENDESLMSSGIGNSSRTPCSLPRHNWSTGCKRSTSSSPMKPRSFWAPPCGMTLPRSSIRWSI